MKKIILAITSSYDLTVDYLIDTYEYLNFIRINVDQFMHNRFVVSENSIKFKTQNGIVSDLDDINSIYYRKPVLPDFTGIINNEYHSFAHKEIFSLIEGIVEGFPGKCLSKPSLLRIANNKIVQCRLAKKLGFRIPKSRITNSIKCAKELNGNQYIVKPLSVGIIKKDKSQIAIQTNIVDEDIQMDNLCYCPSYFQEFINKDFDVRLTIVGEKIFTVRITSSDKVDWRKINSICKYKLIEAPENIVTNCMSMLSHFNLRFGCFDFIVKNGEWFFLELNANGQWAWLEHELGINISKAIIQELTVIK
ncbi:MAG: hypothetical protein PHI97_05165 [Desulfobulbus sp.]|nr:hypothetical protein [Desulfobulbus sp.]